LAQVKTGVFERDVSVVEKIWYWGNQLQWPQWPLAHEDDAHTSCCQSGEWWSNYRL